MPVETIILISVTCQSHGILSITHFISQTVILYQKRILNFYIRLVNGGAANEEEALKMIVQVI